MSVVMIEVFLLHIFVVLWCVGSKACSVESDLHFGRGDSIIYRHLPGCCLVRVSRSECGCDNGLVWHTKRSKTQRNHPTMASRKVKGMGA